jgi:hypothetical protein
LVCIAAPSQPHQGRFTSKTFIYVFTLHQPTLKPNIGGKTNCVGVVPESVKFLIGVRYKCNPFLPSQLFRYWARVTLLLSVPTNQHAYHQGVQAAFSVVRNEGHS